jgi:hypothetical protein
MIIYEVQDAQYNWQDGEPVFFTSLRKARSAAWEAARYHREHPNLMDNEDISLVVTRHVLPPLTKRLVCIILSHGGHPGGVSKETELWCYEVNMTYDMAAETYVPSLVMVTQLEK